MITEDQLEQLAIQWFQDTGWNYVHGAVIAPEGVAAEREALRTLTPALSQGEKEEDGRLVEVVRRMGRPFRTWNLLGDGTQGAALGCRVMPRWGGRRRGPTIKSDLMVRSGVGVRATCKDCLQDRLERNQNL